MYRKVEGRWDFGIMPGDKSGLKNYPKPIDKQLKK